MPIGLGLVGNFLQCNLHFVVLGPAPFFIVYSSVASVPMPIKYLAESFKHDLQEVGTYLNLHRLLLGLIIPLFIEA